MIEVGDRVTIQFLGQKHENCEVLEVAVNGGYKGGTILKVRTKSGRIIPYVGIVENQEKWANIVVN